MNQKTVFSDEPIPPTRPHGYGFFSNFPRRKEGEAVFCLDDPAIDMEVLEGMCAHIPRPCSFYSAIVVWDVIPWYSDSNLTPALRNIQSGHGMEDFGPGEWDGQHDFYECCIGYQSNCLLLSSEYGTGPELEIWVELTNAHPMEDALKVNTLFENSDVTVKILDEVGDLNEFLTTAKVTTITPPASGDKPRTRIGAGWYGKNAGQQAIDGFGEDDDNPHNLANQIFRQQDVGRPEVEALADILFELNPEVKDELKLYPDGWNGQKLNSFD